MTKEEYISLITEWKNCDSLKRREEIESIVYIEANKLLVKLNHLYEKYDKKFIDDSDYIEDKGGLELLTEYLNIEKIILRYSDSWSYGGSCDFNIIIPAKYFDNEEFNALENKLKTEQITFLNKEIENSVKKIKDIQKYIEKIKLKLKTLTEND